MKLKFSFSVFFYFIWYHNTLHTELPQGHNWKAVLKCKWELIVLPVLLFQDRQGAAGRGSGALQVPLKGDQGHGGATGLLRAGSPLQADGEEGHV